MVNQFDSWRVQPSGSSQNSVSTLPVAGGYANWAAPPPGVPPPSAFGTGLPAIPAVPPPTYGQSSKPAGYAMRVPNPVPTRTAQHASITTGRPRVTTVPNQTTNPDQSVCCTDVFRKIKVGKRFYLGWFFIIIIVIFLIVGSIIEAIQDIASDETTTVTPLSDLFDD